MDILEPVYWSLVGFLEILVCFAEWFTAEEARVGGKGRRVRRFDDAVLCAVDMRALCFGVIAPQNKHHMLALTGERFNRRIGKLLPTLVLVRAGGVGAHRKRRV